MEPERQFEVVALAYYRLLKLGANGGNLCAAGRDLGLDDERINRVRLRVRYAVQQEGSPKGADDNSGGRGGPGLNPFGGYSGPRYNVLGTVVPSTISFGPNQEAASTGVPLVGLFGTQFNPGDPNFGLFDTGQYEHMAAKFAPGGKFYGDWSPPQRKGAGSIVFPVRSL
jgi:hypothetical protein